MNIDLAHFKSKLIEEKNAIESSLRGIANYDEAANSWNPVPAEQEGPESDPNDLADRLEDFEERGAMVKTLGSKLADIDNALAKMEKGGYGICEESGEPIEIERLEANPAARTNKAHMH